MRRCPLSVTYTQSFSITILYWHRFSTSSPPPPPSISPQLQPPDTTSALTIAGAVSGIVLGSLAIVLSATTLALVLCGCLPGLAIAGRVRTPNQGEQIQSKNRGWPMATVTAQQPRISNAGLRYQLAGTNIASEESEALRPSGPPGSSDSDNAHAAPANEQHHVVVQCSLPDFDAGDLAQASEIANTHPLA